MMKKVPRLSFSSSPKAINFLISLGNVLKSLFRGLATVLQGNRKVIGTCPHYHSIPVGDACRYHPPELPPMVEMRPKCKSSVFEPEAQIDWWWGIWWFYHC
jgi:hypothetical protein